MSSPITFHVPETVRRALVALVASAALLVAPCASAWNASGHMQVALVAYRELTPAVRLKFVDLIRQHPRFAEDFDARKPDNLTGPEQERQWIFAHAATWPDIARDQSAYHHATWHFINEPLFLDDGDRAYFAENGIPNNVSRKFSENAKPDGFNVVQAMALARHKLASSATTKPDRALYLTWLMHLVGDVHQPLHAVGLYSRKRFPAGDKGGNDILLTGKGKLHSVWDGLLGTSESVGYLAAKTAEYLGEPKAKQAGKAAALDLSVDTWVDESYDLAWDFAYDAAILAAVDQVESANSKAKPTTFMPQSYFNEGRRKAERRCIEAGFRLAALLAKLNV